MKFSAFTGLKQLSYILEHMTQLSNPGPIEFEAVIQSTPGLPQNGWINFPYDLKETYGKGNLVPVSITFDKRVNYRGSLAKMGGEQAMILLRKDIVAELGKGPGDRVDVLVELDTSERKVTLAKDAEAALKSAGLLKSFQNLAFSHQREYNQWIEGAKKPETRATRIAKMCELLKNGKKELR